MNSVLADVQMQMRKAKKAEIFEAKIGGHIDERLRELRMLIVNKAPSAQQAQTQAGLTATQEGNRLRAMEPYERMGQYGSGVMGLISGMGNQYQSQVTPNPTPLQTALGTASVLGGIFNPRKD